MYCQLWDAVFKINGKMWEIFKFGRLPIPPFRNCDGVEGKHKDDDKNQKDDSGQIGANRQADLYCVSCQTMKWAPHCFGNEEPLGCVQDSGDSDNNDHRNYGYDDVFRQQDLKTFNTI